MKRNSEYDANEILGGQSEELRQQALRDKNHAYDKRLRGRKAATMQSYIKYLVKPMIFMTVAAISYRILKHLFYS